MSDKKEIPDHVWNEEFEGYWRKFFVGWSIENVAVDELGSKIAEIVRRKVCEAYLAGKEDGKMAIPWKKPDERPELDREVLVFLPSGAKALLSVGEFKESGQWMVRCSNHYAWEVLPLGIKCWCYSDEIPFSGWVNK